MLSSAASADEGGHVRAVQNRDGQSDGLQRRKPEVCTLAATIEARDLHCESSYLLPAFNHRGQMT